jgi:predicted nuclease with TOPRIM domain
MKNISKIAIEIIADKSEQIKRLKKQIAELDKKLDKAPMNSAQEDTLRWKIDELEEKLEKLDTRYPSTRKLFPN